MKKINKRVATAIIAAVMFAFTSVAASAADYGSNPSYPKPDVPGSSTEDSSDDGDDNDVAGSTADNAVSVVTDDVISDIIAGAEQGQATVYADSDEVIVTEAAIGEIAGGDVVVTIVTDEYSIEIDPSLIDEVREIDLTMDITVTDEETDIDDVAVPANAIVISPAQKGDFGMTISVTIPASSLEGLDTDNLKLYYISDDGETELIDDNVAVNADGSVSVAISHASQYVITDEELGAADEDDAVVEEVEDEEAEEVVTDTNPGTGVMLSTAVISICAAVVFASRKRK